MTRDSRATVACAYVGKRLNRAPTGVGIERRRSLDVLATTARFAICRRHRLLTLEWQRLTPRHATPCPSDRRRGRGRRLEPVMDESRSARRDRDAGLPEVASYAVAMGYRVRFYMEMNARERCTSSSCDGAQGHPA